jgi:hypothetical protein
MRALKKVAGANRQNHHNKIKNKKSQYRKVHQVI